MADKYQNKYRIDSARLKNWDYASDGAYFITICTKNRTHFFGEIMNGQMQFSEIGKIAHQNWEAIPQHFSFVRLDAFIIMPNHTHGILIIDKNGNGDGNENANPDANANADSNKNANANADPDADADPVQTLHCNVSAVPAFPAIPAIPAIPTDPAMAKISPKPGSISTIIRSYKSATTKMARKIHADFDWQTRFHDHVIRDGKSYQNIKTYIINNPKKWENDTFFKS